MELNSVCGMMCKEQRKYICVLVDKKPTVIFKDKIIAITKVGSETEITCTNDVTFYTPTAYKDVVKMIL